MKRFWRGALLALSAMTLTACMGGSTADDSVNSRLTQPVGGGGAAVDSGDIAIAGQSFAKAIRDLPQVSGAAKPPMVQFTGVTSIVTGKEPVDTEPYTDLLRDRLVLVCREKLRFQEHVLPPLVVPPPKKIKSKKELPPPVVVNNDPDYQMLAELRGSSDVDFYKIQIQFVDFRTHEVLYNGLYRIRKEAPQEGASAPQGAPAPSQDSPATGTSPIQ